MSEILWIHNVCTGHGFELRILEHWSTEILLNPLSKQKERNKEWDEKSQEKINWWEREIENERIHLVTQKGNDWSKENCWKRRKIKKRMRESSLSLILSGRGRLNNAVYLIIWKNIMDIFKFLKCYYNNQVFCFSKVKPSYFISK